MKKALSVILSAAVGLSALGGFSLTAADGASDSKDIVIFGDSIAAGYGLSENEYNYGEICADYYGSKAYNYAVSGDTTSDMLKIIESLDSSQKKAVADSGIIIISAGGNDVIHYAAKHLINYAAGKNMLNPGFTAADIPSEPGIGDLMKLVNLEGEGGLIEYAKSGTTAAMELNAELKKLTANIYMSGGQYNYEGVFQNTTIPNLKSAVEKLKAINPNAKIIVQTIYQPLQLSPEYVDMKFDKTTGMVVGQLRSNFGRVMKEFRNQLGNIDGIEVADVFYDFTSVPDGIPQNDANPGHASYFVDIQESGENRDFHPNQKGHLAIASEIITTISEIHTDNGLLTSVYNSLSDKGSYPTIALGVYKYAAGRTTLGDVNFDEKIDSRDASIVLRDYVNKASGGETLLSPLQSMLANVDGNSIVNGIDASMILKYYTAASCGITDTLEEYFS